MIVTVEEMKNYLRIDFEEDDSLIENLIKEAQKLCMDVTRVTDQEIFEELVGVRIPVMYAVSYLYEHREDADHHRLILDLRSMLFGIREPGF